MRNHGYKIRAKMVCEITISDYEELLEKWLGTAPIQTIEKRLGKYMSDARGVTCNSMRRLNSAMMLFMDNGHTTGVLYTKRMESALGTYLHAHKEQTEDPDNIERTAHSATDHMMYHFSMLRSIKDESLEKTWCARFKKTGAFRSKLTAADWDWLTPLVANLKASSEPAPAGKAGPFEGTAPHPQDHFFV